MDKQKNAKQKINKGPKRRVDKINDDEKKHERQVEKQRKEAYRRTLMDFRKNKFGIVKNQHFI